MGLRELFRRRGPAERAARERLERAQTERWPLDREQAEALSDAVHDARRHDRHPAEQLGHAEIAAAAVEREIATRQAVVEHRLSDVSWRFERLYQQDPLHEETYRFLPEPDWDGGRPNVAELEGWAELHEEKATRHEADQAETERLERQRWEAEMTDEQRAESELDNQWRSLCGAASRSQRGEMKERDWLGADEVADIDHRRDTLEAKAQELAERTGISARLLQRTAREAAQLDGNDPGSDSDPDRFAPPDWDELRERDQQAPRQWQPEDPPIEFPWPQDPAPQTAGSGPQRTIHAVSTPEMVQAEALERDMFHQMTLENTPAAFMDDRYSYDDDVWMSDDNGSERLENELRGLVRAHPEQFAGTRFESWLREDEAETAGRGEPADELVPVEPEPAAGDRQHEHLEHDDERAEDEQDLAF